ncbi:FAD-binding protein [bacterium]|nr:MAG: FAD-binding protein [bacterium]
MEYDAIIVGAGPGGLTAGLYLARAGKKTLCLEQGKVGGQIATTSHLENYPGFPGVISGGALMESFEKQASGFGLEIMNGRVDGFKVDGAFREVSVSGFPFRAKVIIIATGLVQKLGIPGEEEFLGRGVSYCATCDGALYRERAVAVTGSSEWALEEALFLTKFVSKLYLVTQLRELTPSSELKKELLSKPCLEVVPSSTPLEISGDLRGVNGLKVSTPAGEKSLAVDGVFIFSGKKRPGTEFLGGQVKLDDAGYVVTKENCETSVEGVYAIGDVRRPYFRQVATAVGDGATAGMDCLRHLKGEAG